MRAIIVAGERDAEPIAERLESVASLRAVATLEDAEAALLSFWPDAAVLGLPWTQAVASWVDRNLLRYGIRTVVIGASGGPSLKGVIFMPESASARDIASALRPRAA